MNEVESLHQQAMDLADQAEMARVRGGEDVQRLFEQAFAAESAAAALLWDRRELEPTRSVLFRSSATLALDCGFLQDAERLAAAGLAGNPPDEIAQELRTVLDQANFHRHLDIRGVHLGPDEMQVSIDGSNVGPGIAQTGQFVSRVQLLETLIYRTAERKSGLKYRKQGSAPKSIKNDYQVYMSVPRAASFAVSIRVGADESQQQLDFGILDELLDCLGLFEEDDQERLKQRIVYDDYYANFVALAKQIAPDGDDVSLVGFTAIRDGKERRVSLRKSRRMKSSGQQTPRSTLRGYVEVSGLLKYADDRKDNSVIILVQADESEIRVTVPVGINDIVNALWGSYVRVRGTRRGQGVQLQDIERDE